MVVSVLHKELDYKVKKAYKQKLEVLGHAELSKTNTTFQHVNKPFWISPVKFYSRD